MRREDVTREQAEAISQKIGPMLGYLNRLKKRMNEVFARDDRLFAEVIDAADALHKLNGDGKRFRPLNVNRPTLRARSSGEFV